MAQYNWRPSAGSFEWDKFEWDERKRRETLAKHGLDFREVISIFTGKFLLIPARSDAERRFAAIAEWNGVLVTVVFTMRRDSRRIITARRARRNEREAYHASFPERGPDTDGQD